MKELFDNIQSKMIEFSHELNINVNKGNKAAGVRARKASIELEKMFKEYRKVSLKATKKMSSWGDLVSIEELKGKVITKITGLEKGNNEVHIYTADGKHYKMWHAQICCEDVSIDDVNGDVNDLLNSPITIAEERTSYQNPEDVTDIEWQQDSFTWTFYTIASVKGYVDIRWYGESNGYYSEDVNFELISE